MTVILSRAACRPRSRRARALRPHARACRWTHMAAGQAQALARAARARDRSRRSSASPRSAAHGDRASRSPRRSILPIEIAAQLDEHRLRRLGPGRALTICARSALASLERARATTPPARRREHGRSRRRVSCATSSGLPRVSERHHRAGQPCRADPGGAAACSSDCRSTDFWRIEIAPGSPAATLDRARRGAASLVSTEVPA